MTDTVAVKTEDEREAFEIWFRGSMYLAGRCFVDHPTKRRMYRAWLSGIAWQARAMEGE